MLCDLPIAAIDARLQHVASADPEVVHETELTLRHTFTRVERERIGAGLPAVLRDLCGGESQRVLSFGLIEMIGDERENAGASRIELEFAVRVIAARRAVIAVALGAKKTLHGIHVERPVLTAVLQRPLRRVKAACTEAARERRLRRTVRRKNLDHAARGIPIERGERTAQDFDALGAVETERSGLTLAVGHRRG